MRRALVAFLLVLLVSLSARTDAQPLASQSPATNQLYLPFVAHLPKAMTVLSSSMYFKDDHYYIVGELYNDTSTPQYIARATATLYDAADRVLHRGTAYTFFGRIKPGQTLPFEAFVPTLSAMPARYTLVADASPTWPGTEVPQFADVTVASQQVRNTDGTEVVGQVRNDTVQTLQSIRVVATFYDKGIVVGVAEGFATEGNDFTPGATSTYTLSIKRQFTYDGYTVQAESTVKQ